MKLFKIFCLSLSVFAVGNARVARAESFGINFLGNTTDLVGGTAGVIPIANWNNIANGSFTSGSIHSSDGSASATLTLGGAVARTWSSGTLDDNENGSLMNGYMDLGANNNVGSLLTATNVIGGLSGSNYNVFLYLQADIARPENNTDYLPNYTVNGTRYYTAALGGNNFSGFVQAGKTSVNDNLYPPSLTYGNYIEIDNVAPVNGMITILGEADTQSYRSPLNGIEIVASTKAPQITDQPAALRLYAGMLAQFSVGAIAPASMVYQWRKNGVNLHDVGNVSGAWTGSLMISNLALSDTGDYTVVITNYFGSVTSSAAHLNVVVETTADMAFDGWLSAYLVQTNGQTYFVNSLTNRSAAFLWGQAYMIWAVADTCDRTQSPQQEQLISDLMNTFLAQNGSIWTWDSWDDDMEWSVIAAIRAYQITGNTVYLNAAITNWNAVYNRGYDSTFGGGIWENMDDVPAGGKGGLSNWPFIIAGCQIYQSTGDTNYLNKAEQIYAWARTTCFDTNTGRVYEGIGTNGITGDDNAYNSGLIVNAANALYQLTGINMYYSDAQLAANHVVNKYDIINEDHPANGDFGAEQFVRGLGLYASQNDLWTTYWPWLAAQCNAAWNERRTDYNVTWNIWTSPTPAGTNNIDAMEAEGAVVVQQVTPTSIPGFIPCTNKLSGTIIGTSGSWSGSGNTIAKVFDENLNTFFDGPDVTGDWVGFDFGSGISNVIGQINCWPRIGYANRMLGGVFQGANNPVFSNPVTLYTIPITPPDSDGIATQMIITNTMAFRYVRYLGPANGSCNVAELQFFSPNPLPLAPQITNGWDGNHLTLTWPNGGMLLEATNVAGPWITNTDAISPLVIIPSEPQKFYRVQLQ